MHWTSRRPQSYGETRERVVFALLPRLCVDGTWRWLEYVRLRERSLYGHMTRHMQWVYDWWEFEVHGL